MARSVPSGRSPRLLCAIVQVNVFCSPASAFAPTQPRPRLDDYYDSGARVLGIPALPCDVDSAFLNCPIGASSMLPLSYPEFVKQTGSRAIVLRAEDGVEGEQSRRSLDSLNGVLLPGGGEIDEDYWRLAGRAVALSLSSWSVFAAAAAAELGATALGEEDQVLAVALASLAHAVSGIVPTVSEGGLLAGHDWPEAVSYSIGSAQRAIEDCPADSWERLPSRFPSLSSRVQRLRAKVLPVFGTCLGFENIIALIGGRDVLEDGFTETTRVFLRTEFVADEQIGSGLCDVDGICQRPKQPSTGQCAAAARPAGDSGDAGGTDDNHRHSALFNDRAMRERFGAELPPGADEAGRAFSHLPIAMNAHGLGVHVAHWCEQPVLRLLLRVTSLARPPLGGDSGSFVNTIEGRAGIPLFGAQFHPEKAGFEPAVLFDEGDQAKYVDYPSPAHRAYRGVRSVHANNHIAHAYTAVARVNEARFDAFDSLYEQTAEGYASSPACSRWIGGSRFEEALYFLRASEAPLDPASRVDCGCSQAAVSSLVCRAN